MFKFSDQDILELVCYEQSYSQTKGWTDKQTLQSDRHLGVLYSSKDELQLQKNAHMMYP